MKYLKEVRENAVWTAMPADTRLNFAKECSPVDGQSLDSICDEFKSHVLPYGSGNIHPGFMGWVQGWSLMNRL